MPYAEAEADHTTSAVTYDRERALDYARAYWNRPTSDGFIAGEFGSRAYRTVPEGTVFVHSDDWKAPEHALLPDGTTIPWSALDDCTHFISCCVGRPPGDMPAGGLPLPRDFPSGPYGVLGAGRFVHALVAKGYLEELEVDDKKSPDLDRIGPGDLIGYYRKSEGQYAHLAMYAGDGNIVCHTYCRADTPDCTWEHTYALAPNDDDWQWRLLRFTVPNPE